MILVTGATGFLGGAIVRSIPIDKVVATVRRKISDSSPAKSIVFELESDDFTYIDYSDIDVIIHLAALAHVTNCTESEFTNLNTKAPIELAKCAASAGVKRFIFISSIKVNGDTTSEGRPFTEKLSPQPQDFCGFSKKDAEDGLRNIASKTGMEVVIIRPPLIYGPGVKANFLSLMRLADTGIPLPFGAINNQRSMVYVENLVNFIVKCIEHPAAANQTFVISDGKDLSLTDLLKLIRSAFGRSHRLLPVPAFLLNVAGKMTGKTAVVDRLIGDLQIDSYKAERLLGWAPPFTVEEGIKATVVSYSEGKK